MKIVVLGGSGLIGTKLVARLRITTAYSYVAAAWAQRLLGDAGGASVENVCCQLLHLYTHVVAEGPRVNTIEGTGLDG